jgi:hypothetical protein
MHTNRMMNEHPEGVNLRSLLTCELFLTFFCSDASGKIEMWEFKFFDFYFLKKSFFNIFQNILF